jgi:hypothetical protein
MNFVDNLYVSVFVRKRGRGRSKWWVEPLICGRLQNGKFYMLHALLTRYLGHFLTSTEGRAIAQAVSRWLPTAAVRVMWDLCWTKWRWGRFSPSTSVSPANLYSTSCSTNTIIY